MVGVKGKFKGCNTCRKRRVAVCMILHPLPSDLLYRLSRGILAFVAGLCLAGSSASCHVCREGGYVALASLMP